MSWKADQLPEAVRQSITRVALEQAIAELVKASGPDCEQFVGVIVERTPVPEGANWAIRGIKYGRANRELCAAALLACVAEKQREFDVSD